MRRAVPVLPEFPDTALGRLQTFCADSQGLSYGSALGDDWVDSGWTEAVAVFKTREEVQGRKARQLAHASLIHLLIPDDLLGDVRIAEDFIVRSLALDAQSSDALIEEHRESIPFDGSSRLCTLTSYIESLTLGATYSPYGVDLVDFDWKEASTSDIAQFDVAVQSLQLKLASR